MWRLALVAQLRKLVRRFWWVARAEHWWGRLRRRLTGGGLSKNQMLGCRCFVLGRYGLLCWGLEFVLDRGRCCTRRRTLECAGATGWCCVR